MMPRNPIFDPSSIVIFTKRGLLGRPVSMIRSVRRVRKGVKRDTTQVFRVK